MSKKVVAIVGPTAVGKTELSLQLARMLGAEIISADSRQVYKGLDCGTAKVPESEMQDIQHHMLNIVSPSSIYTVSQYQQDALACIKEIFSRKKNCLVVGGSGMYVDAILYKQDFPSVLPRHNIREIRQQKKADELYEELRMKDSRRAEMIDSKNKVRLIRALEIIDEFGFVPENREKKIPRYKEQYIIGLYRNPEELKLRIHKRNLERIVETSALLDEVRFLLNSGITAERLHALGLEYRYSLQALSEKISLSDLVEILDIRTSQFAKRQMTWWRRNADIVWFHADDFEGVLNSTR